ncbi:MAG: proton-conducting transporter transmembrane domain-containing protein [Endomicrobiales bacterium]
MNYLLLDFSLLRDPLSLLFLFVIGLVALPSAVYSLGYLKNHYSRGDIAAGWLLLAGFVLSMSLVVTAGNALLFLIAWEVMSLVSYFLVTFDRDQERSVNAGTIYIVMTHLGTACITAALLLMYTHANSFDFAALKTAAVAMPPHERNIAFLLLLAGFGTKAGIVPLHLWLPYAHPQAPSHISSIMSGVMIKTAIYGMLRFIVVILGVDTPWWGNLVLAFASLSCLVGGMYALMENDIKKLLAYSSVENIGIILLGVGGSMLFAASRMPALSALALTAGLYHLINHAIFKSLLFLGAGSVYKATGQRNIEKLGGLIKTMPYTAAAFLVGALAISAIPPLNGFVSEWLTLQSFFLGAVQAPSTGMKILMGMYASVLALTGGLAAACFVKAFGITFLAVPRSQKAREAKEAPASMTLAMGFMALLAVAFGVGATPVVNVLSKVSAFVTGTGEPVFGFSWNHLVLSPAPARGIYLSAPLIFLALAALSVAAAAVLYRLRKTLPARVDRTWGCGYYRLDSRTEYTATAFSKPFRIAFSFFLRPYRKTEKVNESKYHVKSFKYETHTTPVFKRYLYEFGLQFVLGAAKKLRRLQPGSIHLYLGYIFVTMILLIITMRWWF